MLKKFGALLITLAFLGSGAVSQASAGTSIDTTFVEGTDPAAALYNPLVVNVFNLTLPASTIAGLDGSTNNWAEEGPYLPADLSGTVNGVPFGPLHVGIHLKGAWGSWRTIYNKAGFKIKINYTDKNATFYGVQKLTLNNMVQDHSSIHETMSYRLFRAVGVPTARTGYANVFVNGQNYGLHLNLETTDKTLMNHWGISPMHIYKGGVPNFPEFLPGQENRFAIDQGSTTDLSDLQAVTAVVARGNGANWYRDMSALTDLQEMTLDWATESFVGHWDGYVHNHNNFYFVRRDDGKFIMLPWGMDQTWGGPVDYWNGATLFQECRQDSQCNNLYTQALVKVIDTASALNLPAEGSMVAAAINPTLYADTKKEFGNSEVPSDQLNALNFVRSQVQSGINMIAPLDSSLKDFGILNSGSFQSPTSPIVVDNATTSIQLTGHPNSVNASVDTTPVTPLNVGDNKIQIRVSNDVGRTSQIYTVIVRRRAIVTKPYVIRYSGTSTALTTAAGTAITNLPSDAGDGLNKSVKVTMQIPKGMTKAKALSLLKSRFTKIYQKLVNAGFSATKITYVIAALPVANSVKLEISFER